jgi:hypothetical protein
MRRARCARRGRIARSHTLSDSSNTLSSATCGPDCATKPNAVYTVLHGMPFAVSHAMPHAVSFAASRTP